MDIKPCNILMSEKYITELDDALNVKSLCKMLCDLNKLYKYKYQNKY